MAHVGIGALAAAFVMSLLASYLTADSGLLPVVAPENLPFLDSLEEEDVITLRDPPPGYEPATTEAEWEPIYRANLFRDLDRYHNKIAKAHGHPLNLSGLAYQLALLRRTDRWHHVLLVLIRHNAVHGYVASSYGEIIKRARYHVERLAAGAARLRLQLPDTFYAFNLYDEPICREAARCVVPVFSVHKCLDTSTGREYDIDVLLPHLGHSYDRLLFFPWHQKDPRALLRATMQASMSTTCARVQLATLSSSPEGAKLLDVGFSANRKNSWEMPASYKKPYIGVTHHARYKFLINADGHVSSSRMGHIMQTNSVVLKQRSCWVEYYYRSLQPGKHVLEYSPRNVIKLLTKYQDPQLDGELRRLANESQHFCAKYLTTDSKIRYTVRALEEYTKLFGSALSTFVLNLGAMGDDKDGADIPASSSRSSRISSSSGSNRHGGSGSGDGGGGGSNGVVRWLEAEDIERLLKQLRNAKK